MSRRDKPAGSPPPTRESRPTSRRAFLRASLLGASDEKGAYPKANPKTPQDVLATLSSHLGIDTTEHDNTPSVRPVLASGKPIEELC